MAGIDRLARFLLAIPLALITVALVFILVASATDFAQRDVSSNLTAKLVCQNTQTCHVEVTVKAETEPVSGVLAAEIEGGVRFLNDPVLVVSNNGHRAEAVGMLTVPAGESRTLVFRLSPDKSALYPGAYVMSIQLSDATSDSGRHTQNLPVHVWVQAPGKVHILNNSALLDESFGD